MICQIPCIPHPPRDGGVGHEIDKYIIVTFSDVHNYIMSFVILYTILVICLFTLFVVHFSVYSILYNTVIITQLSLCRDLLANSKPVKPVGSQKPATENYAE